MRPQRRSGGTGWLLVALLLVWLAARAAPGHATAPAVSPGAAKAVAYARAQVGKPYAWGTEGPGAFDCSGLAWAAWRHAGLGWERMTAADQWHALRGRSVRRGALRPGDLVFFAYRPGDWRSVHHVAVYVGGGRMVEAPHSGALVRLASVDRSGWFGAARPLGGR